MALLGFDAGRQADIIARGQAGDRAALGQLYDETFPLVYRWALAATRNREDAEDITAETFERALRSLHKYQSRDVPISAWLIRIAQNVTREHRNKRPAWRVVDIATCEVDGLPAADTTAPADHGLNELLIGLTPAQREVLTLRLAGLKVREIAAIQGRAEGTVKALQFAAVRNMRRAVRP
ncbi:MAG: sigma-70 family RNA polymerase sigma factor [Dehalococcoidia bacterium]